MPVSKVPASLHLPKSDPEALHPLLVTAMSPHLPSLSPPPPLLLLLLLLLFVFVVVVVVVVVLRRAILTLDPAWPVQTLSGRSSMVARLHS